MVFYLSPKLGFSLRRSGLFLTYWLFALVLSPYAFSQELAFTRDLAADIIDDRCETCHNDYEFAGNWSVADIHVSDITKGKNQKLWEGILKSVAMGDMPPADKKQLTAREKSAFLNWLAGSLDDYSAANPNPGRATLRRLNRNVYARSVQDLLALKVDITDSLPGDDSGYGFDNNADVLGVSTTLLERSLFVAGNLSNLAKRHSR